MAHFSSDVGLCATLREPGADPFRVLASKWRGCSPEQVGSRGIAAREAVCGSGRWPGARGCARVQALPTPLDPPAATGDGRSAQPLQAVRVRAAVRQGRHRAGSRPGRDAPGGLGLSPLGPWLGPGLRHAANLPPHQLCALPVFTMPGANATPCAGGGGHFKVLPRLHLWRGPLVPGRDQGKRGWNTHGRSQRCPADQG